MSKPFLDNEGNLYEIHSGRRAALSKWLSNSTADQIENEVDSQKLQVYHFYIFYILYLLP